MKKLCLILILYNISIFLFSEQIQILSNDNIVKIEKSLFSTEITKDQITKLYKDLAGIWIRENGTWHQSNAKLENFSWGEDYYYSSLLLLDFNEITPCYFHWSNNKFEIISIWQDNDVIYFKAVNPVFDKPLLLEIRRKSIDNKTQLYMQSSEQDSPFYDEVLTKISGPGLFNVFATDAIKKNNLEMSFKEQFAKEVDDDRIRIIINSIAKIILNKDFEELSKYIHPYKGTLLNFSYKSIRGNPRLYKQNVFTFFESEEDIAWKLFGTEEYEMYLSPKFQYKTIQSYVKHLYANDVLNINLFITVEPENILNIYGPHSIVVEFKSFDDTLCFILEPFRNEILLTGIVIENYR